MKNILIISSKKYTKLKNYTDFVSLIKSRKLEFHILFVEDVEQYDNYLNKDTLVVSFGGDGTALKAMKISWTYDLLFMPLGTGRVGYLVNKSENIEQILDEWIEGNSHINNRKAIIQDNNLKSPAFNEIVLIKNSPTKPLVPGKPTEANVKIIKDTE